MNINPRRYVVINEYSNRIIQVAIDASQKNINEVSVSYIHGYMEATLKDLLESLDLSDCQVDVVERNLNARKKYLLTK